MSNKANPTLLDKQGFQLADYFIDPDSLSSINQELENFDCAINKGGIRNAEKKLNSVKSFTQSDVLLKQASEFLDGKAEVVRVILFNKSPENNWLVSWHQDKTVAISDKFVMDGWKNWTVKDGIHHVQPPLEVLHKMVSFRIHLDDTDLENGCLNVIPRSHLSGILNQSQISEIIDQHAVVNCEAKAGSILVMKPLILHSSSRAVSVQPRRILHIEFSSYQLPKDIMWA